MAYLAYHFHWELEALLDLQHTDRTNLIQEVAQLNERAWEGVLSAG